MYKKYILKIFIMMVFFIGGLIAYINYSADMDIVATGSYNSPSPQASNGYWVREGSGSSYREYFCTYSPKPVPVTTPPPPTPIPPPTTPPPPTIPPPTAPPVTTPPVTTPPISQTTPVMEPSRVRTSEPVATPIPVKIPTKAEMEVAYKVLLESNMDKIQELIRTEDKKWKLLNVSNIVVDLSKGEISLKASFKYKNLWKTSKANAYIFFETIINDDNSKYGIRFKRIERMKSANPLNNMQDALKDLGTKTENALIKQNFWNKDDVPNIFKVYRKEV